MRVLFLTRYPEEGASSRYRVHQYIDHLRAAGIEADVQPFMDEAMYRLSLQPGHTLRKVWATGLACGRRLRALRSWRSYDLLYLQRELFPIGPPWAERWLKSRGAVLLYDYDDALFIKKASRYNPIATWLRSANKTLDLFRIVDCVVAGNSWLRDAALAAGAREAVTVEVAEDTQRISMHRGHSDAKPVTVGWLGSPSTVKYLRCIEPVLQRIAREHPDVDWEIMGGGEFQMEGVDWRLTEWSLSGELEALARFDIGLMPLPAEDWSKGKSGGKARTYMAAGVVPVVQAVGYNLELIRDEETGFLCNDEEEWYRILSVLIQDAPLRQRVAIAARAEVETRFNPAAIAEQLTALIRASAERRLSSASVG